ncbi:unnamed protein product [Urochloa humidicola]
MEVSCPWSVIGRRPSFLSLQDGAGGDGVAGDGATYFFNGAVWRSVGCFVSLRFASSLCGSESPATLEASELILSAKIWPLAIKVCSNVHRITCTSCDVLTDVASKMVAASSEASSLRWVSASSCNLGVGLDVGWWLRAPAMKTTGRSLQGSGCIFCFLQECLCKDLYVILVMNQ